MFRLSEEPDRTRLENAFRGLIRRHESLRTSFHDMAGRLLQQVHPVSDIHFEIHYLQGAVRTPEAACTYFVQPFDLSLAPLLRVRLARISDGTFILMTDVHHIVTDGTSMGILAREFTALYAGETLTPLKLQYRDVSLWRAEWTLGDDFKKQETFWLDRLAGELPELDLPFDFPGQPPVTSMAICFLIPFPPAAPKCSGHWL